MYQSRLNVLYRSLSTTVKTKGLLKISFKKAFFNQSTYALLFGKLFHMYSAVGSNYLQYINA